MIPLAYHTDGVRYQSQLHCNTDLVVGFWLVTVSTRKRHLICSVRLNTACTCGCRGWCSIWVILEHIRWQLMILEDGVRPLSGFDKGDVGAHHSISRLRAKHGDALGVRASVLWVKGDWAVANMVHQQIPSPSQSFHSL